MIPFPYLSAHQTGSRYIVMPAVLTTDDDWLVLVEDLKDAELSMLEINRQCRAEGEDDDWERCTFGEYVFPEEGSWSAWRNGDINLIVTDDKPFYLRKVAATLLAAKLNLKSKDDRIALFEVVQGRGDHYDGPLP